ncbi:MAG: hypothetical protein FJX77_13190, partial [Armatimonadetes bacterium]|nr:hypothetical protein [Armatimonadota bacterium]
MMGVDPKKLVGNLVDGDRVRGWVNRLTGADDPRPFRWLGRRLVQTMARSVTPNPVAGHRSAPSRYMILRVVPGAEERDRWESLFQDAR